MAAELAPTNLVFPCRSEQYDAVADAIAAPAFVDACVRARIVQDVAFQATAIHGESRAISRHLEIAK